MTGADLSTLKDAVVTAIAVLPATSVQVLEVTVRAVPSPVVVLVWLLLGKFDAHVASGPEMSAFRVKVLVTSWLYQPAPLARLVGPLSLMTGAVLSTLNGALVTAMAALP